MLVLQPKMFHLFLLFLYFFIAHFLLVENTYKNPYSLKAVKRRMIGYFQKIMSKIPGDNGSSLNKLITLQIIASTKNITLIETSVLVVYP
jgi:hypothetical protein